MKWLKILLYLSFVISILVSVRPVEAANTSYTVQPGDTLIGIAARHAKSSLIQIAPLRFADTAHRSSRSQASSGRSCAEREQSKPEQFNDSIDDLGQAQLFEHVGEIDGLHRTQVLARVLEVHFFLSFRIDREWTS